VRWRKGCIPTGGSIARLIDGPSLAEAAAPRDLRREPSWQGPSSAANGNLRGAPASNAGVNRKPAARLPVAMEASMKTTLSALGAAWFALAVATAPATAADKPTDPQIAHIAYSAGALDVQAAKLALSKTRNPEVKAFARSMRKDHEAVNKMALALVKKLHVTPQDNPTSQALAQAAKAKNAELRKLRGAAFDKAYIANEVAFHKQVNGALETVLIPSAQNPELKSLLETGLKLFQGHEQHAEHVAAELK
jgi:putative membrane protein